MMPADFPARRGRRPDAADRQLMLFRCVQVLRRLLIKNREIGLFCNIVAVHAERHRDFPGISAISSKPTARSRRR